VWGLAALEGVWVKSDYLLPTGGLLTGKHKYEDKDTQQPVGIFFGHRFAEFLRNR
jgi:hypothetical protein